mgnify:CR=1 FL=1
MPDTETPSPVVSGLAAVTILVRDLAHARTFYGTALGLPVIWSDEVSAGFDFGNTIINLLQDDGGPDLIGPVPVSPVEVGTRIMFSVFVEDVDALITRLAERGVPLINGPIDRPWGKRTACFLDPDGTVWEIAQDI